MFKFSIRDLLFITAIIALALGWWLDRSRLAPRAAETDAYRALSETLVEELQYKNPIASVEITVNGRAVRKSTGFAAPESVTPESSYTPNAPAKADSN